MNPLDYLERKLGRFAIANLTLYLVMGQTLLYLVGMSRPEVLVRLVLIPELALHGEYWRFFTFVVFPPAANPIFAFLALYFFYVMGTALEGHWGELRYNVYLLIAYLATIAVAFVTPGLAATNLFIAGSVFLAFAYLYPDFIIYVFFILPVKVKWLALLTWLGYAYVLIFGSWQARLLVLASVANFLLFFGVALIKRARYGSRHMRWQAQHLAERNQPFHTCAVCGITDQSHPQMDFRYCPQCGGDWAYCTEHLNNHPHKRSAPQPASSGNPPTAP